MYKYKKVTKLCKLCLLPKIHKELYSVPEKLLDYHLKPIMDEGWSHIKGTEDFLKMQHNMGKIPKNYILVTADVVGLYSNISHYAHLKTLKDALDCKQNKKIHTDVPIKMAVFVLTNNYFDFGKKLFHQISETAVGTKFAPTCASIFMDKFERDFLKM